MPDFLRVLLIFLVIDLTAALLLIIITAFAYRGRLRPPGETDRGDGSEVKQLLGCALILGAAIVIVYLGLFAGWYFLR